MLFPSIFRAPAPCRFSVAHFFTLVFLFFLATGLRAQTPISSVVNIYTPIVWVGGCHVDVESTQGLTAGDRVLVIQMTGASIETSNTPAFGSIVRKGEAGSYELATIASISGNRIALTRKLLRRYDLFGKVQLVRVARYDDATVVDTLGCPAWNGSTGGVIAIEATGSLTLNSDIVATGKGFPGGVLVNVEASCTRTDYFYDSRSTYGANKGEGIAIIDSSYARGRGPAANAGGGGNDHNGGGGGGANLGGGGMGGFEFTLCSQGEPATRGWRAKNGWE